MSGMAVRISGIWRSMAARKQQASVWQTAMYAANIPACAVQRASTKQLKPGSQRVAIAMAAAAAGLTLKSSAQHNGC